MAAKVRETKDYRLRIDYQSEDEIGQLAAAFNVLAQSTTGQVEAEVTTAAPMPEKYYLELQKVLEKVTGKKVVVVRKQDPSIIAGVITRVGDKVFDGSVRNRLTELKEQLLAQ